MHNDTIKPSAMELGEDGDTVLVFGKCSKGEATTLIRELLDGWDNAPKFDPDELEHLPVVVEGTPASQKDAPYPDIGYWWGQGDNVGVVTPTRVSEGWLVYLTYEDF